MEFLPRLLQALAFLPGIISSVEGLFGNRSGQQKKESVISFLSAAMQLSEAVTKREIVDETKFREGLSEIVNGVVACLNASSWSQPK